MKAVIDRTYAFFQQLSGKTFYFIITCEAPEAAFADTMLVALRGFTSCVENSVEGGYVLEIGTNDPGDVKATPAMTEAYELGKRINNSETDVKQGIKNSQNLEK